LQADVALQIRRRKETLDLLAGQLGVSQGVADDLEGQVALPPFRISSDLHGTDADNRHPFLPHVHPLFYSKIVLEIMPVFNFDFKFYLEGAMRVEMDEKNSCPPVQD
jgi:hypothetical protein